MTPALVHTFLQLSLLLAMGGVSGPKHGTPLTRNFNVVDYGAEAQNWAITQDDAGVMYFGNNAGVLMYNGVEWQLVPISNHAMVNTIEIAKDGTVFVGGSGDFGYLERTPTGEPIYHSLGQTLKNEDRVFGKVWNIHITSHGTYFRARERMFRYDGQRVEVLPYRSHIRSAQFADAVIYNGRQFGLWVMDEKGTRLLPHTQELFGESKGSIILPLTETSVLLAVRGMGLFEYNLSPFMSDGAFKASFDPQAPGPQPWANEIDAYLKENRFYTAAVLDNGFAFGTRKGGVVITNRQGRLLWLINRDSGLLVNRVRAVYQDKQKNIWVALNNGLALAEINNPLSLFPGGISSHEGVIEIADFENRLYVGAHNGLFFLDEHGQFQLMNEGESGFWTFYKHKGRLLTTSKSVYEINGSKVQAIHTPKPTTTTIFSIGSSPRFPNHLFIGNRDGIRVLKTNSLQGKPLEIVTDFHLEGLHEEIRRIEADAKGNLWLSTRLSGLIYLELNQDDLRMSRAYRFGKDHGLPRLDSCKMLRINGRWRVATKQGIYRLAQTDRAQTKPGNIRFVPDPEFNRFQGKHVNQILEDTQQRTWVTTNKGVGYFERNQMHEQVWHDQPFKRIGEGLVHIASDDTIWVDSPLGLYRLPGDIGHMPSYPFHTQIHRVTVNEKLVYGGFGEPGMDHDSQTDLNLSDEVRGGTVSFHFNATFYENSGANRYRFFLEGYDKQWSDWSKETYTNYTNLKGGSYRFHVQAMNLYDQLGTIAGVDLQIPKPWFQTSFAYFIFGLGLLGLLACIVITTATFQKKRHEKRRQLELKQQELQKFDALGRLAGGIAHDFNGILATIYGFTHHIEKATRTIPGMALPFEEIEKAGKRGRDLVRQILAFSRGEKPRQKLLNAGAELNKALDLAQITLPPGVHLIRRIDADAGWLKGNPTRCHQVVLNLFRNAVQALDGQPGSVEVGLDTTIGFHGEKKLRVWVRDDGVGMDTETQNHLFEPFYTNRRRGEGTGLGLWVVHSIVTSMEGTISVSSSPGKGCLIEMFFKKQAPPAAAEEKSLHNLPKGRGQRVLWIDSSKQRLREGILLLRTLGYKAGGALIHELPLSDFEREPDSLDLIVMGCDEEPVQGQALLARIRDLRPDIPVICWVTKKGQDLRGFQGKLEGPLAPKSLAQVVFNAFSINTNWDKGAIT